jgi:hypothetical protein
VLERSLGYALHGALRRQADSSSNSSSSSSSALYLSSRQASASSRQSSRRSGDVLWQWQLAAAAPGQTDVMAVSSSSYLCRYLAELTKFRIAPPSVALLRLRALLDDFSGPAVDGTAALLEGTGRFLLRLPGKACACVCACTHTHLRRVLCLWSRVPACPTCHARRRL